MLIDTREVFQLGVCHYPEHWPRDRWERYAAQMRELGISYARIAEFAWSRMEPTPGAYDWGWLDDAVEVLHAAGLKVILCTPTATPPAWLCRMHPEILPIDREGRRRDHGGRKHYDHASPVYREHSRRITEQLARRYGQHPAVVGWQTDNEFGCEGSTRSWGGASAERFPRWLEEQYRGDIRALNDAWGNVFWSQEYNSFDQINPPNLVMELPNPSHVLDFYRFASDMVKEFQEEQVVILRRHSPGRWVTHNFMRLFSEFDHYEVVKCLDFATWDSYPTGGVEYSSLTPEDKVRWARTGHPDLVSINHDIYRGLLGQRRGCWGMEQQNGQINWASHNPLPATGAVALWTAQAYAHGCDVVSYFRDRAATVAQELMHSGLLRHDETLDRGGEEVAALELGGRPNGDVQTLVVLLHDYESLWVHEAQPHSAESTYWDQVMMFYSALRSLGVDVDIRCPDQDLSGYRVIVEPAVQLMSAARATHLADAARSAHVVVGPRFAYRTETGRVHEDGQPGPMRDVLGCALRNFDGMRPGLTCHAGGHEVGTWAEAYRLTTGSAAMVYEDGPMKDEAAVVRNGNAWTIGAWSESLVRDVLERVLSDAGVATTALPDGIRVSRRGQIETWMNFNEVPTARPGGTVMPAVSFEVVTAVQK
ncbi:MAG: beta-galactosidase [Chloroflexota bacterium]